MAEQQSFVGDCNPLQLPTAFLLHTRYIHMVALLLYSLTLLLFALATLVCAILSLCLRNKARAIVIDVLLVVATLTMAVGLSATFLPKDALAKSKEAQEAFKLNFAREAELWGTAVTIGTYIDRVGLPWKPLHEVHP